MVVAPPETYFKPPPPELTTTPGAKDASNENWTKDTPVVAADFRPDPNGVPPEGTIFDNQWYNQEFDGFRITEQVLYTKRKVRMVCVGAGAVGLTVAYKAEHELENVELQIYEKNNDVGGTWLVNRYPGCTCDIPAHSYQFTWARNPNWSSFYAKATEIWQYFKDTAVNYDLEKYIKFEHRVESATWNEGKGVWDLEIRASNGSVFKDCCEILVNGSGILDEWAYPDIPGVQEYEGKLMHSAHWDQTFDLTGKTVAVIGGGSSAVQIIPNIQPYVKKLIPFLRSPVWVTTGFGAQYAGPNGTNFRYSDDQKKKFQENPLDFDQYVRGLEGELNKRFTLMHVRSKDQKISRDYVADQMRTGLGNDELAAHMIPHFGLGCRRMTPGEGYLQSLTKQNVQVVRDTVVRFTKTGIVDAAGVEHQVDAVVCATGFANLFKPHFKVVGRGGKIIQDEFGDQPIAYMSVMAEHFPNMFLILGPNGPVSHGSLLPLMEWHTRYMFQMVTKMQREMIKSFDPKPEAIRDHYNYTHELFKRLIWSGICRSWFKNGRMHGPVTAVYPGSRLHYFEQMRTPRYEDYNITYLGDNRFSYFGNGYTWAETVAQSNPVWYFDDLQNDVAAGVKDKVGTFG